jgi:hypothetical protein
MTRTNSQSSKCPVENTSLTYVVNPALDETSSTSPLRKLLSMDLNSHRWLERQWKTL